MNFSLSTPIDECKAFKKSGDRFGEIMVWDKWDIINALSLVLSSNISLEIRKILKNAFLSSLKRKYDYKQKRSVDILGQKF